MSYSNCEVTIWLRGRVLISLAIIISGSLTATIVKIDKVLQECSLSLSVPGFVTVCFGILSSCWAGFIYFNCPQECGEEFTYFMNLQTLMCVLSILPIVITSVGMVVVKILTLVLALTFPTLFIESRIKSR